jgi:hypothetical protein
MVRVALVEWSEKDWRIFRQEQWMAEVRRDPSASGLARINFDLDANAYSELVETWTRGAHGSSRRSAVERLLRSGAVEVAPRGSG